MTATALISALGITSGWVQFCAGNYSYFDPNRPNVNTAYQAGCFQGTLSLIYVQTPESRSPPALPDPRVRQFKLGPLWINKWAGPSPSWFWSYDRTVLPGYTSVTIPLWWAILPLSLWTAWRWWRFKPLAPGECPRCRYDAAGLDACPECGEAITP